MEQLKRKANNSLCEIVEPGCNNNSLFEIAKPAWLLQTRTSIYNETCWQPSSFTTKPRSSYFTVFLIITVFALDTPVFQRVGKFIEAFVFQANKLKILKQKYTFSAV